MATPRSNLFTKNEDVSRLRVQHNYGTRDRTRSISVTREPKCWCVSETQNVLIALSIAAILT